MRLVSVVFSVLLLQSSLWATTESKLLAAIPEDCNIVVGIEVAKVLEIPMVKGLMTMSPTKAGEFDPKLIKSMVIGIQAEDEAAFVAFGKNPKMIMVIEATKALTLKEAYILVNPDGAELTKKTHLDKEYFSGVSPGGDNVCIYQLSPTSFIIATDALMKKGITVQEGKSPAVTTSKLMTQLLKSDDGNLIYAGGFMKKSLEYKGFSLGASYNKALNLQTKLFCKKPETAAMHATQLNGMVAMITVNPQLGLKADSFKIAAKKSTLHANALIPEATLAKLPMIVMMMMQQK